MSLMNTPIEQLIGLYDNISAAARELGVKRQTLQLWKRQGFIPYKMGSTIEEKTAGQIKATDIWQAAGQYHS